MQHENTIELETPIKRESGDIKSVTLRKPNSGELRGLNLIDLGNLDVNALHKVLPRITTPLLTEAEVKAMDVADLTACGMKVAGFLLPKSMMESSPQS